MQRMSLHAAADVECQASEKEVPLI